MLQITKISKRHQTVVPTNVRKALKLRAGDSMYWHIAYRNSKPVVIADVKPKQLSQQGRGLGKHLWETTTIDNYINDLRNEWNNRK